MVKNQSGAIFKLEDPKDDNSCRIRITEKEQDDLAWAATLANIDCRENLDEKGNRPDLTTLHWDCTTPENASRFQLVECERDATRTERDLYGALDAHIRVGFTFGCMYVSNDKEMPKELKDKLALCYAARASVRNVTGRTCWPSRGRRERRAAADDSHAQHSQLELPGT